MFDQTFVPKQPNRWSMAASVAAECVCVAAVVVVTIWRVDPLGAVEMRIPLPPLRNLAAVKIVHAERSSNLAAARPLEPLRIFTAPSRIPSSVARIDDAGAVGPVLIDAPHVGVGVPGSGMPSVSGIVGGVPVVKAPPPTATPIERQKSAPVPVGGKVMEARLLKRVMPIYPPLARAACVSGIVKLMGIIARDGTIQQ